MVVFFCQGDDSGPLKLHRKLIFQSFTADPAAHPAARQL